MFTVLLPTLAVASSKAAGALVLAPQARGFELLTVDLHALGSIALLFLVLLLLLDLLLDLIALFVAVLDCPRRLGSSLPPRFV